VGRDLERGPVCGVASEERDELFDSVAVVDVVDGVSDLEGFVEESVVLTRALGAASGTGKQA